MTDLRKLLETLEDYVVQALAQHDQQYQRHPSTERDRQVIVDDLEALRQALAQPDEVLAEREACARLVEADGLARGDEGLVFIKAAGRIRARSEKPPVKTYCGGKPNYCSPEVTPDVDAVNMSQERVDETVKCKREWVGLTEWMPIETAPKNGTEVLVMYVHIDTQVVHNGFWLGASDTDDESDIGWWSYEYSEVSRIKLDDWMTPTHWLPLPKLKEKNI